MIKSIPIFEAHERFLAKIRVNPITECWEWQASKSRDGYGQFTIRTDNKDSLYKSHRVSYEMFREKIPDLMVIDHICRNRKCCNPEHLKPVTSRQNTLENSNSFQAINALKTHCPRGHDFVGENLKFYPDGSRYCKICHKIAGIKANKIFNRKRAIRRLF